MIEPDNDDLALTVFLDGEMDSAAAAAFTRRLEAEPGLRARRDRLAAATAALGPAFGALLAAAPAAAMEARLAAAQAAAVSATRGFASVWRAAAAAVVAAAIFGGGFAASRLATPPAPIVASAGEDWREAVAEYMALYTAESFGASGSPRLEEELALVADRLGLDLAPAKLELAGLSPRRAELLRFGGAPLGQIGYVDGDAPLAFCIHKDGEADAPIRVGSRGGFGVASWAKGGRGFMLIGAAPADRLAALARTLEARL